MDLIKFRSLSLRDFENDAVISEIAGVIKELERRRRRDPHDMVNMYQDNNNDLRAENKILKQKVTDADVEIEALELEVADLQTKLDEAELQGNPDLGYGGERKC